MTVAVTLLHSRNERRAAVDVGGRSGGRDGSYSRRQEVTDAAPDARDQRFFGISIARLLDPVIPAGSAR
jgi:hypothetical protein